MNDDPEQADLPRLVRAVLAELKPREREIIELNLRHDLNDADLATVLDVSWSRAHALAARARGRLEKALGVMLIAHTRRKACPRLDKLLSDWDGQLTKQKRHLVTRHIDKCGECARHTLGELRPTAISGLLPLAELPPELREPILVICASATPDAVAYRRRALLRAESIWSARFWPVIRRMSWRTLRSDPRSVTIALAVWLVAVWVVGITLLMFASPDSSHAATARPSTRAPLSSPAAAAVTTTAPTAVPTSASATPSRTAVPSPTYVAPVYVPSAPSPSPEPSKSPKPSKSPSPSSSHPGSSSPSPPRTTSQSASPSKTP